MRVVMFYHSLVSDWNHGNAHFLRGVASELMARGHRVTVLEEADNWSRSNLVREQGEEVIAEFRRVYPRLRESEYTAQTLDLDREYKVEQEIINFSTEEAPLSVGVVFDASSSMGAKLQRSREAVAQFMKTANPEDEFFLVQFNDRPE